MKNLFEIYINFTSKLDISTIPFTTDFYFFLRPSRLNWGFVPPSIESSACRMSMFFFRLHNLQREEANKKKKKIELRQRRGAKVFRRVSRGDLSHLTAPSRLFEKTPMNPSDSLDEIALQIPRFVFFSFFASFTLRRLSRQPQFAHQSGLDKVGRALE